MNHSQQAKVPHLPFHQLDLDRSEQELGISPEHAELQDVDRADVELTHVALTGLLGSIS